MARQHQSFASTPVAEEDKFAPDYNTSMAATIAMSRRESRDSRERKVLCFASGLGFTRMVVLGWGFSAYGYLA